MCPPSIPNGVCRATNSLITNPSRLAIGVKPLYSFTERASVESTNEAGEVVKTNVFKHVGFVEV